MPNEHAQKNKGFARSSTAGILDRMACYCYILECVDGTYYTGWTVDPERRLSQHNKGIGSHYTRTRLPVKIVYLEPQPDRRTAMKRERAIKKMSRKGKKKLIL